jgi:hypothetical protein
MFTRAHHYFPVLSLINPVYMMMMIIIIIIIIISMR